MPIHSLQDPDVIASSGESTHLILVYTAQPTDIVSGWIFELTPQELIQADSYETENYQRTQVQLASGKKAWVYVAANPEAVKRHNPELFDNHS